SSASGARSAEGTLPAPAGKAVRCSVLLGCTKLGLKALAINMLAFQRPWVYIVQAVDVYRDRRRSVRHLSIRKTLNSAGTTELMADHLLVKEVLRKVLFTRLQLKRFQ